MTTYPVLARFGTGLIAVATGLTVLGACGSSSTRAAGTTSTSAAGGESTSAAESAYCDTARRWAVHELVPVDDSSPAATERETHDYVAVVQKARREAPQSIHDDWVVFADSVEQVAGIIEKYGYSFERIGKEATKAEQAVVNEPPPAAQRAQDRVHAYEADVCASGQPAAASVKFRGPAAAGYCKLSNKQNADFERVRAEGARPADIRTFSNGLASRGEALVAAAPPEIRADVTTLNRFNQQQVVPLLARYNYDMRRVLLDGTQHEREVLNDLVPEVRTAYTRVNAYEQQLCGSE